MPRKVDRLPDLAAELVRLKVDVIVAAAGDAGFGGQECDQDDPHRLSARSDPLGKGLVDSLARPGGNVTGITSLRRS